jgi:actin-like ATPase involved in cell morphogenesis
MRTRQHINLIQASLSVTHPHMVKNLQESVEVKPEPISEEVSELVEYVSSIVEETERQLKTNMSEEEITQVTEYVIGHLQANNLIEEIEEQVGFELNEEEINYVFKTLSESV